MRRMLPFRSYARFAITFLLGAFTGLSFTLAAHAAVGIAPQLNYEGKLFDSSGNAVSDSAQNFVFNLYTAASLGSPIWTETWNASTRFSSTLASGASAGA